MNMFQNTKFWKNYLRYDKVSNDSSMRGFVDAILLWELLLSFPKQDILEIGCYQGLTTGLFFDTVNDVRVTCIDTNDRLDLFRSYHRDNLDRFEFILADSQSITKLDQNYDMIFIDGDHGYESCWHDIQLALQHLAPSGILALDDYTMPGVSKAIENLYGLNNGWIPFLQGIQTQYWHHCSQDKNKFLDTLLLNPINNFIFLQNTTDIHSNTILEAKSVWMLTDHYQIFDQALKMYKI